MNCIWWVVATQYWWEYDSNINFFTGSIQMGEGVNVILVDIKIGNVLDCVIIFILTWSDGQRDRVQKGVIWNNQKRTELHPVTRIALGTLTTDDVHMHRYTFFTVLYPVGVTGELLCLYAAQSYVASKKLWSVEMPNKLNFTFSYHCILLFTMLLYIPRKLHRSVVMQSLLRYAQSAHLLSVQGIL